MEPNYIELDYIMLVQPIGTFYIASIPWKNLLKIAEADIRQIHKEDDKDDSFDSYLGIQRQLSGKRISEIGQYVTTVDATFPTSVILHIVSVSKYLNGEEINSDDDLSIDDVEQIVDVVNIKIDTEKKKLLIRDAENIARILDGQHRIEGLRKGFESDSSHTASSFDFNVTIFVDLDIDDQAQIFSVINKAQTKVNKSLVYDLYDYAKTRSPQKTAHDIVRLLNRKIESPFYRKIKVLGTALDTELETVAQATLAELIIDYISKDPMKDRDILKRKTLFGYTKLKLSNDGEDLKKRIFRKLFIEEKDEIIMSIIWNYFKAVQEKWQNAWNGEIDGTILNKSTGIIALMKFLKPVYNAINKPDQIIPSQDFKNIFDTINLQDASFTRETYFPGSAGQSKLLKDLKSLSAL
jgi:DGQHR domain-containing protein